MFFMINSPSLKVACCSRRKYWGILYPDSYFDATDYQVRDMAMFEFGRLPFDSQFHCDSLKDMYMKLFIINTLIVLVSDTVT